MHAETIEYKGFNIVINYDESVENPFMDWDGEPDIVTWLKSYDFTTNKDFSCYESEEFLKHAKKNGYIVKPLRAYIHSGIAFSTSSVYPFNDQWDSGFAGFIYWTREQIKAGHGEKFAKRITAKRRAMLESQLESAVELLNAYANGNVYWYDVQDKDGKSIDSCGGYYGYNHEKSGLLESAKFAIDRELKARRKAKQDKAKTMIRNRVPLEKRAI